MSKLDEIVRGNAEIAYNQLVHDAEWTSIKMLHKHFWDGTGCEVIVNIPQKAKDCFIDDYIESFYRKLIKAVESGHNNFD